MRTQLPEHHACIDGHKIAFREQGEGSHQVLVMWGDKDPFQKPDYALRLVDAIPNAELVSIKDAGHWLIDEKPAEIAERINQFLG